MSPIEIKREIYKIETEMFLEYSRNNLWRVLELQSARIALMQSLIKAYEDAELNRKVA
jgi:hypothetical protein